MENIDRGNRAFLGITPWKAPTNSRSDNARSYEVRIVAPSPPDQLSRSYGARKDLLTKELRERHGVKAFETLNVSLVNDSLL